MRTITVHRKGYFRQGVWIAPTTFKIPDRGAVGKGEKMFEIRKGRMTRWAIKLGYIKKGQSVSDIPAHKVDDFARELAEHVGSRVARGMFQAQVNLRKGQKGTPFKTKMKIGAKSI